MHSGGVQLTVLFVALATSGRLISAEGTVEGRPFCFFKSPDSCGGTTTVYEMSQCSVVDAAKNGPARLVGDAEDIALADLNQDGKVDVVGFRDGAVRLLVTEARPTVTHVPCCKESTLQVRSDPTARGHTLCFLARRPREPSRHSNSYVCMYCVVWAELHCEGGLRSRPRLVAANDLLR